MVIELLVNSTGLVLFASYQSFDLLPKNVVKGFSNLVDRAQAINLHGIWLHSLAHSLSVSSNLINHNFVGYFSTNARALLFVNMTIFMFLLYQCRPCLVYLFYVFLQTTPEELQYYLSRMLDEVCSAPGVIGHRRWHL